MYNGLTWMPFFFTGPFFIFFFHHSFTRLHFYTMKLIVKLFFLFLLLHSSFTFVKHCSSATSALSFFNSCTFLFCDFFFVLLSFSVVTEGYMDGSCGSCIFDRTNQPDILPWTRAVAALYLHTSIIVVQVKILTPNWQRRTCNTAISVKISIPYTYHSLAVFITLWCMRAYSFITLGHGGDQTTNPASVTVTL